jgi:hypothetical protein
MSGHRPRSLPARLLGLVAFSLVAMLEACNCGGPMPCTTTSDCPSGQVCGDDDTCRMPLNCDACAEHQLCEEGSDGADADCLAECETGYAWDGTTCGGELTGCDVCAAVFEVCISDDGPVCGDCIPGFSRDAADTCVPNATCDPAPAEGSIVDACTEEHRVCVEDAAGALCGDCSLGFIEVDDVCEAERLCDADFIAECGALNRECVDDPNGQCAGCLSGFIPELDGEGEIISCRAPVTCADIEPPCPGLCNPHSATSDAYCSEVCTGPNNLPGVENQAGTCIECGLCTGTGEDGPYLQALYAGTSCICKPQDNFYFDQALLRIEPCDEDQDGWVRESAKLAQDQNDVVVQANFRCNVRTIDTIDLRNEAGESKLVPIADSGAPVKLFESDRNDDQALLSTPGVAPPPYGARALKAEELNTLTKACVGGGDFNGNGAIDATEWHGMDVPNATAIHLPLVDFTYYVELYRGWYEPDASGTGPGTYVIAEKSRAENAAVGLAVPLVVDDETTTSDGGTVVTNGYWRQCDRLPDSRAATANDNRQGFDFAEHSAGTSFVMGHHSQFKCMLITPSAGTAPHEITRPALQAKVDADEVVLNDCNAGNTAGPTTADRNPSDPIVSCDVTLSPIALENGDTIWAVMSYADYGTAPDATYATYQWGCVNECEEYKDTCPGYDPLAPETVKCDGIPSDFGRLVCGCDINFGGASCENACPGSYVHYADTYDVAYRRGFWMCGTTSASDGVLLEENAGEPSIGYTVRGEVPAAATPVEPLCETTDVDGGTGCGGYSVSGFSIVH